MTSVEDEHCPRCGAELDWGEVLTGSPSIFFRRNGQKKRRFFVSLGLERLTPIMFSGASFPLGRCRSCRLGIADLSGAQS